MHLFQPAAFWGDIALDDDDLRMFKDAQGRQIVQTNHTDSGIKENHKFIDLEGWDKVMRINADSSCSS